MSSRLNRDKHLATPCLQIVVLYGVLAAVIVVSYGGRDSSVVLAIDLSVKK